MKEFRKRREVVPRIENIAESDNEEVVGQLKVGIRCMPRGRVCWSGPRAPIH